MSRGLVQLEQRKSSKRVGLVIVLISFCGHYVVYIYINDCRYQVSLPHLLSYSDLFRTVKAWNPRWLWWRCSPAGGWEALHCGVWQVRAGTLLTNMTSSWKWYEPIIESFQVLGEIFTEVTSYFRVLSWLPRTLKRFWKKTLSIPPHGAKSRLKLDFISNIPVKGEKDPQHPMRFYWKQGEREWRQIRARWVASSCLRIWIIFSKSLPAVRSRRQISPSNDGGWVKRKPYITWLSLIIRIGHPQKYETSASKTKLPECQWLFLAVAPVILVDQWISETAPVRIEPCCEEFACRSGKNLPRLPLCMPLSHHLTVQHALQRQYWTMVSRFQ